MKIHIGILTSDDADKAARCLASALVQQRHPFEVSCSVLVNSTKGYYFGEVMVAIGKVEGTGGVPVISTESNGKPGKGKNEAFAWMRDNVEADYYMLLDGDDFLYPVALETLAPALEAGHQLIMGLSQDVWLDGKIDKSWHDAQPNNAIKYNRDIVEGEEIDLWNSYSIDRVYAISKDFLQWMPKMKEDLDLYEDFCFTVECTKLWEGGKLDYVRVNNSHIYAYDATGESQCSLFNTDKKLAQWNMDEFESMSKEHIPVKFSEVPFIELKHPENFSMHEKVKFYDIIKTNEAYSRTEQRY